MGRIIEAEMIIKEKKRGASLEEKETYDHGLNWLDDQMQGLGPLEMGRDEGVREAEPQTPVSRNESFVVTQANGDALTYLTRKGAGPDKAIAAEGLRQWQEAFNGKVESFTDRREAELAVQTYGGQIMEYPEALQRAAERPRYQSAVAEWAL